MIGMEFFSNLKTKYKLVGSFLLVTLIFVAVAGVYHYSNATIIDGYSFAIDFPINAAFHMDEAKLDILQSRLNTEKFISSKKTGYLVEADKNLSQMLTEMEAVKECAKKSGRDDLMPIFASIDSMYQDCAEKYKNLNSALKTSDSSESVQGFLAEANEVVAKLKITIDKIQEEARKDAIKFVEMTHGKSDKLADMAVFIAVIAVLSGLALGILISLGISNPISRAVRFAEEISKGNFAEVIDIDRKDEVGVLVSALNLMKINLSDMVKDLKMTAQGLSASSSELSAISSQMAASSEDTSNRANNVSNASEEMSTIISSVAASMNQSNTNALMVATAAEQMTSTIDEIAKNAEKAQSISNSAVHRSDSAKTKVDELGKAALTIGKVTETITEISEQTNLLALNATIEAARAGEAGKGFAVVANEIKELAKQTAEATLNIKNQISSVQETTRTTIVEIDQISTVIKGIDDFIRSIASAIEEQSSATKEIANNIAQTSSGINEVSENVGKSSQMAATITEEIGMVSAQTQEVSSSSSQVRLSAEELSKFSERLSQMVNRFRV